MNGRMEGTRRARGRMKNQENILEALEFNEMERHSLVEEDRSRGRSQKASSDKETHRRRSIRPDHSISAPFTCHTTHTSIAQVVFFLYEKSFTQPGSMKKMNVRNMLHHRGGITALCPSTEGSILILG